MTRHLIAHLGVITLTATVAIVGAPGTAQADEVREDQWHLEELGINDAHELSQGEGVTIGVIDTGINAEHPDLTENVQPGTDFGRSKKDGLNDEYGHGTMVASTIAGHGHGDNKANGVMGVAPKATILSVGVHCDYDAGYEGNCGGFDDWISEAISWLVEQDVDIISASVRTQETHDAVAAAADAEIPLVAPTGNTPVDAGEHLGMIDLKSGASPASNAGAIPVSGVDPDLEFWSKSVPLKGAAVQPQFGLAAPSAEIPVATNEGGYEITGGTSFAAPIVAGTLALIKSAYPDLSYELWIERLLETVNDKGEDGYDDKYGWGIVNPLDALTEEVTFEGRESTESSSPDARLPLEEQGKGTSGGEAGDEDAKEYTSDDGNVIAANTSGVPPAWLIIAIVAGLLIVTAAIITTVVLTQHRKKHQPGNNPPRAAIPAAVPRCSEDSLPSSDR